MLDGHGQREVNGQPAPADGRQSASTIRIGSLPSVRCSRGANIPETAYPNADPGTRFPTRRRARSERRSLLLAGVLLGHTGQFPFGRGRAEGRADPPGCLAHRPSFIER